MRKQVEKQQAQKVLFYRYVEDKITRLVAISHDCSKHIKIRQNILMTFNAIEQNIRIVSSMNFLFSLDFIQSRFKMHLVTHKKVWSIFKGIVKQATLAANTSPDSNERRKKKFHSSQIE